MGKKDPILDERSALIVIDMQIDFLPGGNLPVEDGDQIIDGINKMSKRFHDKKGYVVFSQDWHPVGHGSFASAYPDKEPGDDVDLPYLGPLWPDHCVQGTKGAEFDPKMDLKPVQCIIRKGYHQDMDSYSAFYENDGKTKTGLTGYLKNLKIKKVFITGVATDFCCFFSAMDAKRDKFRVFFIEDLTKGIDQPPGRINEKLAEMRDAGIQVIKSTDVPF